MARALLPGCSIVLVEDEAIIRMMVAEMVTNLGHRVCGEAGDVKQALQLIRATEFDLALLDINLNGSNVSPVADLLESMGKPFVFLTGYGLAALPEHHRERPVLQKPFAQAALGTLISAVWTENFQRTDLAKTGGSQAEPFGFTIG